MPPFIIDRQSYCVSDGTRIARLSPTEFLIFLMLWAEYPRKVPSARIEHNFYRMRRDKESVTRQCLSTHLHNFEKKIAPLRLKLIRTSTIISKTKRRQKKTPLFYGLSLV